MDRQGVDFAAHHFAERGVNHAVAGDGVLAAEGRRDDAEAIVTAPRAGAGMAGVQRAVVDQRSPYYLEAPKVGRLRDDG